MNGNTGRAIQEFRERTTGNLSDLAEGIDWRCEDCQLNDTSAGFRLPNAEIASKAVVRYQKLINTSLTTVNENILG